MIEKYKNLIVWQKSVSLAVEIYKLTESFPKEEVYGLTSQMRRCSVSVASNIAEGKLRGYQKEFKHFLMIAYGSGGELETQILIAKQLGKTARLDYSKVDMLLEEIMKMLNKLVTNANSLKA